VVGVVSGMTPYLANRGGSGVIEYFTILMLTYSISGETLQSTTFFPSADACGDALPAYYEPVYAFDKNAIGQCKQTDVLSSTIRPKAKPSIGHVPEQEMENN